MPLLLVVRCRLYYQARERRGTKWKCHDRKVRARHRVYSDNPWTAAGNVMRGVAGERRESMVNAHATSVVFDCRVPSVLDISQCVSRMVTSQELPCMTTISLYFSYKHQRCLIGPEHIALQGQMHPAWERGDLSEKDLGTLAGEAMHAAQVGQFLLLFFLNPHAPWWLGPV